MRNELIPIKTFKTLKPPVLTVLIVLRVLIVLKVLTTWGISE
jgi:hypothetical protein